MLKKILQAYIRFIQRILVGIALFFLYFLGFGITSFFLLIFNRKLLYGTSSGDRSFWCDAEGYENDPAACERES